MLTKYRIRFNYYTTEIGVHFRTTKLWWKPFYWLGNINFIRYGKLHWWVRKYLTYD